MTVQVLLIEDDPSLARGLVDNFRAEGWEVRHVSHGDQALQTLEKTRPDLVILDILLPGRSGLDILREMRSAGETVPVLMLTAKGEVVDRVVGLELGADDYLPKPFALQELLARVRALLRRSANGNADKETLEVRELTLGNVHFDFQSFTATGPEGLLDLTPYDIQTLKVLAEHRGELVRRLDIVEEVSGMDSLATARTVDNHIVSLRRALGDDPRRPRWIHTVRGEGYRLAIV